MFVMNFYEIHMNNLKSIILSQNETITAQRKKMKNSDKIIKSLKKKVDQLEMSIKEQDKLFKTSYRELKNKNESSLEEVNT